MGSNSPSLPSIMAYGCIVQMFAILGMEEQ